MPTPPLIPAIAILAGGQSRRMGTDKALLPFAGLPMIQHIARAAAPLTQKLYIVGRPEIPHWPPALPATFLPDPPSQNVPFIVHRSSFIVPQGPTAAIIHILQTTHSPTLLLPCDTPLLTTTTLAALWHFHNQQSPTPIATLTLSNQNPPRAEPLLALYTPEALPALTEILTQNLPLQSLLQNPTVAQFPLPPNSLHELTNINTPATLAQAEALFHK